MKLKRWTLLVFALSPLAVRAQITPSASPNITIPKIFARLSQIFNKIIPLLVLLATFVFLWGVVRYITAGGDEEKIREARQLIVYGVVALAVMITVWALVFVVVGAFFGSDALPALPGPDLSPFL